MVSQWWETILRDSTLRAHSSNNVELFDAAIGGRYHIAAAAASYSEWHAATAANWDPHRWHAAHPGDVKAAGRKQRYLSKLDKCTFQKKRVLFIHCRFCGIRRHRLGLGNLEEISNLPTDVSSYIVFAPLSGSGLHLRPGAPDSVDNRKRPLNRGKNSAGTLYRCNLFF